MKKKYSALLLVFLCAPDYVHSFTGERKLQTLCTNLFGSMPAPKKQQEITREALSKFGIDRPELIPIKLIRHDINLLQHYTSFTWFGIWFNEHALKKCSKCNTWLAYHEAAHYALLHPYKIIGGSIIISAGSTMLCRQITRQFISSRILNTIIAGAGSKLISFLLIPELVQRFELKASKLAAHKLCSLGKMAVVEDQIEHLKNLNSPESSRFLPPIPDQLGTLQSIVEAWRKRE